MLSDTLPASERRPAVVVFGEVLVDVFPDRQLLGGAPFNVARHLQAFGVHAVLISRVGDDALRDQVRQAMADYGMDVSGLQFDAEYPTGQVRVQLHAGGGHSFDILPDQAYDFIGADGARQTMLSVQPDMVYFGTLAQRYAVARNALGAVLGNGNALHLLDVNLRAPWYDGHVLQESLRQADVVKVNAEELAELTDLLHLPGSDSQDQAASLLHMFDLRRVVVTCGADGAWQLDAQGETVRLPAAETEVIDTVGAGDGFAAVLILGEVHGWPVALTMARASAFAAAVCGLRGAVPADDGFYAPFRRQWFAGRSMK